MLDPLETILRQCAEAAPNPWYPSGYAQANGIRRDDLDPHLDQLRMAGMIHLTDWVQGQGQGYALTPEGERVLQSPREMARLRAGKQSTPRNGLQEPPSPADRRMTPFERGEEIRAAFLHPSPAVVSFTLIFINIVWFLWGITIAVQHGEKLNKFLYASTELVLRETGALSGEYIVEGQWFRLLTSCFVHIGLLHLGVNMYSLWAVGPFFEQLWGRGRFLVLYLIAGLGGSCAMVISNPMNMGAGASGAIWGILAAHAVWIVSNRRYLPRTVAAQMLRSVLIVLVINVVITYSIPNISAAAHFGGGAVGAATALLLNLHRFGGFVLRAVAVLGLVAIPVLCLGAVVKAESVDPRWEYLRLHELIRKPLQEATQILESRVEPLRKQQLKVHSLQDVQQAVGALEKARARLTEALERLREAGPYRDKKVEGERERIMKELEKEIYQRERTELLEFAMPLVTDALRHAQQLYPVQWEKLESLDEERRTSEVVGQVIAPCHEALLQAKAAVEVLRETSPSHEQKLEKQRLKMIDDADEGIRGWKRTEQRMRKMAKTVSPPSK